MSRTGSLSADLTTFDGRTLVNPPEDLFVDSADVAARLGLSTALAAQLIVSEWATRLTARHRDRVISGDVENIPISQLGHALGVTTPVPMSARAGRRLMMARAGLERLEQVPLIDPAPMDYLHVRLGPGTMERAAGRRVIHGVHASFTDAELIAAATTAVPISGQQSWIGMPLVASISGFVAVTGRITAAERTARRTDFRIDPDDETVRQAFADGRVPLEGGSRAAVVHRG